MRTAAAPPWVRGSEWQSVAAPQALVADGSPSGPAISRQVSSSTCAGTTPAQLLRRRPPGRGASTRGRLVRSSPCPSGMSSPRCGGGSHFSCRDARRPAPVAAAPAYADRRLSRRHPRLHLHRLQRQLQARRSSPVASARRRGPLQAVALALHRRSPPPMSVTTVDNAVHVVEPSPPPSTASEAQSGAPPPVAAAAPVRRIPDDVPQVHRRFG